MKKSMVLKSLCMVTIFLITACATPHHVQTAKKEATECPETRPQMCTMDYNPVCGSWSDGSVKTYANGCNACADANVTGYIKGECQ